MFSRTTSLVFLFFGLVLGCGNDDTIFTSDNIQVDFVKTYGGSKNESGQSVISTQDGGYAILGFTQSMDGDITNKQNESYDYWVIKFNSEDQIEWQQTYGGSGDDRGRSIIQTLDGGYAILGTSNSNDGNVSGNSGMQDYWLAKLNNSGNLLWQSSFGFEGSDSGMSVIQTNDMGFLISGVLDVTASNGQGNTERINNRHAGGDYWVLKLDNAGNMEWSKYFGGNFTDTPEGVVQLTDNGFIIVGGSDSEDTDISNNIGSYDFWAIRISSIGELIWEKSFGGTEIDEARGVVSSHDGNFIIAGDTRSFDNDISENNGAADLWLIKISAEGELIWEKTIGGSNFDAARAIVKSNDNGFLLAGSTRSDDNDFIVNQGQNDAWVLKIDNNGNLQWQTTVGGDNIDFAYGITQLSDGSIIATGDTRSNNGDILENKGFTDLVLIKIDENI